MTLLQNTPTTLCNKHLHCHGTERKDHSEVGGEILEDSSSAPHKGCAAEADKGVDVIEVVGFAEGAFAFFGGFGGSRVAELLELVAAMMGGGGQSGSLFLGLDELLEFGGEVVIDDVGGVVGWWWGIVSGRGFGVNFDFGGKWLQQVSDVGPSNNYIKN